MAAMYTAGCGGGGGGGSGGPSPIPTIPVVTPTPGPSPTPSPTPLPSNLDIILREDDQVSAGVSVGDIEDAALADDGTIAAIIEIAGQRGARAVVRQTTGGEFATVFEPEDAPDFDSSTLEEVKVAPGGRVVFESQVGTLDADRIFLTAGDVTQPIAGAAPGIVAPDFRIGGDDDIGTTGRIGLVTGGSPCTVTQQGDSVRTRCAMHLFVIDDFAADEITVRDIDLSDESPNTPQVEVADSGTVYFSVPGGGTEPTIVRVVDGDAEVLLFASTEVDPVGRLNRPQLNALNLAEDLLVTTTLAADPGPTRPSVIGILRDNELEVVAREELGTEPDDVTDLRAVGIDDAARVLFIATLGTPESALGARRSLRLYDAGSVAEVATEGMTFPDTELTLLSIGSVRFNRNGDVAFVAELGRREPGTVVVEESRGVRQRQGGPLTTVLTTRGTGEVGPTTELEIAGFASDATLLFTAQGEPSGDRLLIIAEP